MLVSCCCWENKLSFFLSFFLSLFLNASLILTARIFILWWREPKFKYNEFQIKFSILFQVFSFLSTLKIEQDIYYCGRNIENSTNLFTLPSTNLPGIEHASPVTGDLPTPLTHNNTQQHYTTALGYIKLPMYLLFLWCGNDFEGFNIITRGIGSGGPWKVKSWIPTRIKWKAGSCWGSQWSHWGSLWSCGGSQWSRVGAENFWTMNNFFGKRLA